MTKRISYTIEYTFKAKAELLYQYLITPNNLSTWFADDCKAQGEVFSFTWNKSIERAKLIKQIFKKKVVFQWLDRPDNEYLTIVMETDDMTSETNMLITDFDFENQTESAKLIWNTCIENLKRLVGG